MVYRLLIFVTMALLVIGVASPCPCSMPLNPSARTIVLAALPTGTTQPGPATLPPDGAHCLHGKLGQSFSVLSCPQAVDGTVIYALLAADQHGLRQEPRHRPPIV